MKKLFFLITALMLIAGCTKSHENAVMRRQLDSLMNIGKPIKIDSLSGKDYEVFSTPQGRIWKGNIAELKISSSEGRQIPIGIVLEDSLASSIRLGRAFVAIAGMTDAQINQLLIFQDSCRRVNKPENLK